MYVKHTQASTAHMLSIGSSKTNVGVEQNNEGRMPMLAHALCCWNVRSDEGSMCGFPACCHARSLQPRVMAPNFRQNL